MSEYAWPRRISYGSVCRYIDELGLRPANDLVIKYLYNLCVYYAYGIEGVSRRRFCLTDDGRLVTGTPSETIKV